MDLQDPTVLPPPPTPSIGTLPKLPELPKLPSMGAVLAPRPKPIPLEQEPMTPPPTVETDTPQNHQDNFGWLKNLPKSMFDFTKSVVYDMPKAVLTSAVTYARDPEQYGKDLNITFSQHNGLGRMFREQMVDYYTKDFWHNFNEDPAHFLGDLAAVASLGGGTVAKLGEVGKLASVARVGETVAKVGTYLDPLTYVGKAASIAAAPALEALGFGKYTRELNALRGELAAGQAINMNSEVAKHIFGNLSPVENDRLLRLITWGERGELDTAALMNDTVGKRLKIWRETITGGDEPLYKQLHLLDDDAARRANAIKMSEYSKAHTAELGLHEPVTPEQALGMMGNSMQAGTHNPTFMSTYRMKAQFNDLFEAMNRAQSRGGLMARFERITGGGKNLVTNVDELMARQIVSKHDSLYKIRLLRAIEGRMQELGEWQFIHAGSLDVPRPGFGPLQGAHYEKYYHDLVKSGENTSKILQDYMAKGLDPKAALAEALKATQNDVDIARAVGKTGDVYLPKHVVSWINRELAPISPMGAMYDKGMRAFKPFVTLWNPKFWGSVIFGNATLGLIYGVSPDYARVAFANRDFLPPELRNITKAQYFVDQMGVYSRVADRAGEWSNKMDNLFRIPIFAQEVSNDAKVRMKFAGGQFLLSQDQVFNAVRHYGQAPERLMQTRLQIQQLKYDIASGFREFRDLDNTQNALGQAVARAASREGPRKMAPGYDELGRKITAEAVPYPSTASPVGGKAGPKVGVEYNELGQQIKGPNKIQDPVYGELDTKAKRHGPEVGTPETDPELMRMAQNMVKGGYSNDIQSAYKFLEETHKGGVSAEPHIPSPGVAAEHGHSVPYDFETGHQGEYKSVEGGAPPKLGPVDTAVDPITGHRIAQDPEIYGGYEPGKPLTPGQERIVAAVDKYGNIEEAIKSRKEDILHKMAELGELQKRIPGLAEDAAVADRAIEAGNRFYGSIGRLSPFERKTVRRLLPFYTFNKAMTMLAWKFPFLYPKRAFIGAHLAQAWNDIMSDENSFLPARLKDYVPVMAREDGSVVAISSGYMNALSGAKVGDFAELPLPSVFNPLKANPIIALILKMNGAIPEWTAKPLSPGEYATRLDNGTVVQWTGKGFRTEVAQPSVFKSLFDLFPQAQLIDRLVHPFAQTDRGWLFNRDPIASPDGTPRYPKELIDLVLGNVIPTQTYDPTEVQSQERERMAVVYKSYVKDLKFATPVRREQILEVLRGWQNEKNRRWVQ